MTKLFFYLISIFPLSGIISAIIFNSGIESIQINDDEQIYIRQSVSCYRENSLDSNKNEYFTEILIIGPKKILINSPSTWRIYLLPSKFDDFELAEKVFSPNHIIQTPSINYSFKNGGPKIVPSEFKFVIENNVPHVEISENYKSPNLRPSLFLYLSDDIEIKKDATRWWMYYTTKESDSNNWRRANLSFLGDMFMPTEQIIIKKDSSTFNKLFTSFQLSSNSLQSLLLAKEKKQLTRAVIFNFTGPLNASYEKLVGYGLARFGIGSRLATARGIEFELLFHSKGTRYMDFAFIFQVVRREYCKGKLEIERYYGNYDAKLTLEVNTI